MKAVAKYNLFKGVSTVLTVGTPIVTLCSCSDFFVHRSDTAISAGGIFALLLTLLLAKDKIAENFKAPSAFILSTVTLILLCMIEQLILPLKYVCIATMCATGIDEVTFKRFYKNIESTFPENSKSKKMFGFMFTTTDSLLEVNNAS